jgi:hypothetical protein
VFGLVGVLDVNGAVAASAASNVEPMEKTRPTTVYMLAANPTSALFWPIGEDRIRKSFILFKGLL